MTSIVVLLLVNGILLLLVGRKSKNPTVARFSTIAAFVATLAAFAIALFDLINN